MAEFTDSEYKDQCIENTNAIPASQVAKQPDIKLSSLLPFPSDCIRGSGRAIIRADVGNGSLYLPQRHQYLYSSPYQTSYIEDSSHLPEGDTMYDSARPGTPALRDPDALIDHDVNSVPYRNSPNEVRRFAEGARYQQRYNHSLDRPFPSGASREPNLVYPPTAAPPTSPSQLYALLLQRNIRPTACAVIEPSPQVCIPNHIEWNTSNIFQARNIHQNDHRRDIRDLRERERIFYRRNSPARQRFDQYGYLERQPFLNQNYTRLPHSMVRIKNTDDDKEVNGVNGFAEDDEGNHECRDLRHDSVPMSEAPNASTDELHHGSTLQTGPQLPESNRMLPLETIYQGEWPLHRALWMSGPSSIGEKDPLDGFGGDDVESIMSFSSSTATMTSRHPHSHQLGTKVEMVYSLLSMLGSCNKDDMSRTLLEMSSNQDSCIAMRQSGCLPLLIQLLHGSEREQVLSEQRSSEDVKWAVREARRRASQALHNIVHAHPDDRRGRREARVLRLLEQIRDYSDFLRDLDSSNVDFSHNENLDLHPGPAIAALMKLSFDEEHRHAMCQLGGLQAIAELIQADHEVHGNTSDQFCVTVRRYAGMALTNLTFGDGTNKALLCSMKPFMQALVAQLHSPNEDLRQVTASVLRNLSWRADASSKQILREVGVVPTLMKAALEAQKESTLKSILSALWNLSAHCSMNKADICEVEGALEFLVSTLTYKSASNTLSIIENGGGILRNVSSHIAVREDYRIILRRQKCLQTLLSHLKSPSLTIVSNACGTLWNLSARCAEDQQALWEMGAVGMLRNLVHSKHKMISMGSSAALKNLLAAKPDSIGIGLNSHTENGHHLNGGVSNMPSLLVRKQRSLAADIDEDLAETCDNIDSPKTSPTPHSDFTKKFMYEQNGLNCLDRRPQYLSYLPGRMYHSINGHVGSPIRVPRSESKDSLGSTHSEPPHYKAQRERFKILINNNRILTLDSKTVQEKPSEWKEKSNLPFEGNSNVVLQLFRHLQSGAASNTTQENDGSKGSQFSSDADKPAVRPNSLPPPKRGVWNVRSVKLSEQNVTQNGLHYPQMENGFCHSETNGYVSEANNVDISKPEHVHKNISVNSLLEIPGNKRSLLNGKCETEVPSSNGVMRNSLEFNSCTLRGNSPNLKDQIDEKVKPCVILRRRKPSEVLSSSTKALSKETVSDEASADHTPLVISRCSSLSSLTSCFQHSARSSWVSDVSQRTSTVISPSDLPDSPGYCTSEEKPCVFEFTDKVPDANVHGLIRPRPAWPISSVPSTDSLPSSVKRMSLESDVFVSTSDTMPLVSTSDKSENSDIKYPQVSSKSSPLKPQNTPVSPEKELCSSESSSSPENNEGQDQNGIKDSDLLAACISLGMPNNVGGIHHNVTGFHSKVNNMCTSLSYTRSGIPVKTSNQVRLTQSFPTSKPDVTAVSSPSTLDSLIVIQGSSKYPVLHTQNTCSRPVDTICDDNDNLLFNSSNTDATSRTQSSIVKPKHNVTYNNFAQAFESKCLNVCKKYPALSQKSGFGKAEQTQASAFSSQLSSDSGHPAGSQDTISKMVTSSGCKPKTAIPQVVRPGIPSFDGEQHPKQLQIKSQNLPIFKGATSNTVVQECSQKPTAQENTSSTEENVSEDILSSSPSACDESGGIDSEDDARMTSSKPGDIQLRNNRAKSKKNKMNRRSMEVRPPSEQSSEDDNKNIFSRVTISSSSSAVCHITSLQSSESEGKVKEDQRTKEKIPRGVIPDLLEGAAFHDDYSVPYCGSDRRPQNGCVPKSNVPKIMTDSMELRRGALMIAAELEEGIDDCTHSSASFDLENMKPPSCMAEMSMTSSGLSDLLSNGNGCYITGKRAVDRRRNIKRSKKLTSSHRFVLKSVRQSLMNNLDAPKQFEYSEKPISAATSVENISMKSSGTSDLIENINPPSILDDISMTNSCASLNSISSDILESRSQSLADPRSNSEMFQRLNAAAAMVQVYSRELSNIMTGSMKSSCNSDCLDLVKPPSIFQDIAEVTMEDRTEIASDALVSDFELEEELPHDDEASIPSTETVHSPLLLSSRNINGSTENVNSSIDGDSLVDREHFPVKRISSLALPPSHISSTAIDEALSVNVQDNLDANDYCSTENGPHLHNSIQPSTLPAVRRGPRIVKPINRETVRQMQEKKNAEKSIKSVRGKAPLNKPKNLLQQITSARINGASKSTVTKPSPSVSSVRPTRTSALRASQNKQPSCRPGGGRVSPRSLLSKPPTVSSRNFSKLKQVTPKTNGIVSSDPKSNFSQLETKRPQPLVKQGTFTKDETIPKVPPGLSSSTDIDILSEQFADCEDQNNNDKLYCETSTFTTAPKIPDRKLSFSACTTSGMSSTNRNLQRKYSAPVQKTSGERTGIPLSPSSQSVTEDDRGKKIPEKKSPSSSSFLGRGSSAVGSRTASTNSLSSLSSNSLSVKKSNSQKDVPSKISSIWKRSESSSSGNSPATDSSNAEKNSPSGFRSKVLTSKSATLRCNSVTPPASSQKNIPRSSTYEKLNKPGGNLNEGIKAQPKAPSNFTGGLPKTKQPVCNVTQNKTKKLPTSAPPKPSGGPRIVKPVTPRPKINAVTSKSLRQSSSFSPFSETRSYSLSSGPPACISIERSSRYSQDSKVSIPLVTAPFAYNTPPVCDESNLNETVNSVGMGHVRNFSQSSANIDGSPPISTNKNESDSEGSDREGV